LDFQTTWTFRLQEWVAEATDAVDAAATASGGGGGSGGARGSGRQGQEDDGALALALAHACEGLFLVLDAAAVASAALRAHAADEVGRRRLVRLGVIERVADGIRAIGASAVATGRRRQALPSSGNGGSGSGSGSGSGGAAAAQLDAVMAKLASVGKSPLHPPPDGLSTGWFSSSSLSSRLASPHWS